MDLLYNEIITLFNRKPGARGEGDIWYPTVIKNVNLNIDRAVIVAQYGPQSQDNAVLNIPFKKVGDEILVADKPWMPPLEWDQTADSLTFASGTDFDFFWVGEWGDSIAQDANYPDEGFYGYMNRMKDYVFAITSVAKVDGFFILPHFEIVGK